MNDFGRREMMQRQDLSLSGERLAELERRLHGRLRAHRLSSELIARHLEDAVQKGVVECLRVKSEGTKVLDPEAFVAEAAFRRAIDEVRRESRRADGAALDAMLETGRRSSASAEEVAIGNLESERLQEAIESLPVEERQVLNLYYFEGLDQRGAAKRLYMSERTYRRRLRRALSDLAERLGVPAPESDSTLGLAIGLAAWTGLDGGRIATPPGAFSHLGWLVDSATRAPTRIAMRLRESGTRLLASEASEQIGAIVGGPAGKVVGGCAGAAIVCALSGVVGPGVDLSGGGQDRVPATFSHHAARAGQPTTTRPILPDPHQEDHGQEGVAEPTTTGAVVSSDASPGASPRHRSHPHHDRHESSGTPRHGNQPTDPEMAEEQFSGMSRAAAATESESSDSGSETTSVEEPAPTKSPTPSSPAAPAPSSTSSSSEADRQFGFGR
jgi:RNA polymerase sigma factor (sigma-70 family)